MTDYITFLTTLAQVMKNLKKLKRETTSALDTINTNFDITEVVTTADPSIGLITGIISVAKSADKEKKNNEKIKNAVNSAKNKLSALDKWIDADFAQYLTNQINILLEAQGWTKAKINELLKKIGDEITPVSSASTEYYSYQEIKKNTKTQELDVHTHGSYSSMTFNHIIFGDAAEDQTQAGAVITVGLQFVPGLDTILDVRDVVVDGYLWVKKSGDYSTSEKVELGVFTSLDVVGFIPIVGVLKYSDEVADLAKSGKNISKARDTVKTMEKIKDIEHTTENLKNIGNTADNAKNIGNVTKNAKEVEKSIKNIQLPKDDSQLKHIFRNKEGHLMDTPENRQKLLDLSRDESKFKGIDKYGNSWNIEIDSDGGQYWVRYQNGLINEGGKNKIPRAWNNETGLNNNPTQIFNKGRKK